MSECARNIKTHYLNGLCAVVEGLFYAREKRRVLFDEDVS